MHFDMSHGGLSVNANLNSLEFYYNNKKQVLSHQISMIITTICFCENLYFIENERDKIFTLKKYLLILNLIEKFTAVCHHLTALS